MISRALDGPRAGWTFPRPVQAQKGEAGFEGEIQQSPRDWTGNV